MIKYKHQAQNNAVSLATFSRRWEMLGMHGQQLGEVGACGIDLLSGQILYLVLDTPWQELTIPWQNVSVDAAAGIFQLRSAPP